MTMSVVDHCACELWLLLVMSTSSQLHAFLYWEGHLKVINTADLAEQPLNSFTHPHSTTISCIVPVWA